MFVKRPEGRRGKPVFRAAPARGPPEGRRLFSPETAPAAAPAKKTLFFNIGRRLSENKYKTGGPMQIKKKAARAALYLALLLSGGCGTGLPPGKINPLPIDIVRKAPPDTKRDRRRYYGSRRGGRRGGGGSGPTPEGGLREHCAAVLAAAGDPNRLEELLGKDSPNSGPMAPIFTAYRRGVDGDPDGFKRASELLNALFESGSCRR